MGHFSIYVIHVYVCLDKFRYDDLFEENEQKYRQCRRMILNENDDDDSYECCGNEDDDLYEYCRNDEESK
jgi:hypothetical protein